VSLLFVAILPEVSRTNTIRVFLVLTTTPFLTLTVSFTWAIPLSLSAVVLFHDAVLLVVIEPSVVVPLVANIAAASPKVYNPTILTASSSVNNFFFITIPPTNNTLSNTIIPNINLINSIKKTVWSTQTVGDVKIIISNSNQTRNTL